MAVTLTWAGFSAKRVNIGTGGWTTGASISDDGVTLVARADVQGAFIFNDTTDAWEDMIELGKVPSDIYMAAGARLGGGAIEVCPAPSDSNIIYTLHTFGRNADPTGYFTTVLKSTDRGATSAYTNFPGSQVSGNGNGIGRQYGPKMAVDPVNPNVVIAGLQNYGNAADGGTYLTLDGGVTWTEQNTKGLPKAVAGSAETSCMTGLLFDRSSVSGGRCLTIYAFSGGNGLYRTTDGGTSWTQVANIATVPHVADAQQSKVTPYRIYLAPNPDLDPTDARQGWSVNLSTGAATKLPLSGDFRKSTSLAPHPTLASCVVAMDSAGDLTISYDAGATWQAWSVANVTSPDIPWLALTAGGSNFLNTCRCIIDSSTGKARSGKLIVPGGIGVARTTANVPSSGAISASHIYMTKGIELLPTTAMAHPLGSSKFQIAVQDRRCFSMGDSALQIYPSRHAASRWQVESIAYALDVAWAKNNPSFLALGSGFWDQPGRNDDGYSLDGGATWNAWPTLPTRLSSYPYFFDGCMAAATDQNIIWWPVNRQAPVYTKDRGTTWLPLNLGGGLTGEGDWLYDTYPSDDWFKHFIDADNVNIGTYLLYVQGSSNAAAIAANGLYLSNNSGDTWTKIRSGFMYNFEFHPKLRHVNGIGGAYLYTAGSQDIAGIAGSLFRIQVAGGGTGTGAPTVTTYPGVVEPIDFAIGKQMPGKAWPRIWFLGWLNPSATSPRNADNAAFGLYYTDDADLASPTWTKAIGGAPLNNLSTPRALAASTEIADLAVIGYGTSGCIEVSRP